MIRGLTWLDDVLQYWAYIFFMRKFMLLVIIILLFHLLFLLNLPHSGPVFVWMTLAGQTTYYDNDMLSESPKKTDSIRPSESKHFFMYHLTGNPVGLDSTKGILVFRAHRPPNHELTSRLTNIEQTIHTKTNENPSS